MWELGASPIDLIGLGELGLALAEISVRPGTQCENALKLCTVWGNGWPWPVATATCMNDT